MMKDSIVASGMNVTNSYGLYIKLGDGEKSRIIRVGRDPLAKHSAEICVKNDGKKREFTLEEFLERLGFMEGS